MAKVQFPIDVEPDEAQILLDAADILGVAPSAILRNGVSVETVVSDMVAQSMSRLRQAGVIPAEVKAEITAFAAKAKADRLAGASLKVHPDWLCASSSRYPGASA